MDDGENDMNIVFGVIETTTKSDITDVNLSLKHAEKVNRQRRVVGQKSTRERLSSVGKGS